MTFEEKVAQIETTDPDFAHDLRVVHEMSGGKAGEAMADWHIRTNGGAR